jgi:hypothetical protein
MSICFNSHSARCDQSDSLRIRTEPRRLGTIPSLIMSPVAVKINWPCWGQSKEKALLGEIYGPGRKKEIRCCQKEGRLVQLIFIYLLATILRFHQTRRERETMMATEPAALAPASFQTTTYGLSTLVWRVLKFDITSLGFLNPSNLNNSL